jgi:hypothetical protein
VVSDILPATILYVPTANGINVKMLALWSSCAM